jgi:protein-tyrosine phosphatase
MSTWFRTYGYGEILDRLVIGAYPLDEDDVAMLEWIGVKRILNLVEDEEYGPGEREAVEALLEQAGIDEFRIRLTDYGGLPPERLEEAVTKVDKWLGNDGIVYVHCRAGWQRSAAIAAGVVMLRKHLDVDEALAFVKLAKHSAEPLDHQREDLQRWWHERAA